MATDVLFTCIKDTGRKLGLITDGRPEGQRAKIAALGLADAFDEIIVTDELGGTEFRKPNPEAFELISRRRGVPFGEMAYVGDTLSRDVRGVRNASWRLCIQIFSPNAAKRDRGLAETGLRADYNITDLSEIPGIIRAETARC